MIIILINRNMSCECARPLNNRSHTLQKCVISNHIIESFFVVLYSTVSYVFLSSF